jgi:hypothetical protein
VITTEQYWAAQPPAVRKLHSAPLEADRLSEARALAAAGHIIDVPIMVFGFDPDRMMEVRENLGFLWVPSALQPTPGNIYVMQRLPIPPAAIKVSRDPLDYPPFVSAPDPTWIPRPVWWPTSGDHGIGSLWHVHPADVRPLLEHVSQDGMEFRKIEKRVAWGTLVVYERVA